MRYYPACAKPVADTGQPGCTDWDIRPRILAGVVPIHRVSLVKRPVAPPLQPGRRRGINTLPLRMKQMQILIVDNKVIIEVGVGRR